MKLYSGICLKNTGILHFWWRKIKWLFPEAQWRVPQTEASRRRGADLVFHGGGKDWKLAASGISLASSLGPAESFCCVFRDNESSDQNFGPRSSSGALTAALAVQNAVWDVDSPLPSASHSQFTVQTKPCLYWQVWSGRPVRVVPTSPFHHPRSHGHVRRPFHLDTITPEQERFVYGSSTASQQTGLWRGILQKQRVPVWRDIYQTLKDCHHFMGDVKNLVQFCFLDLFRYSRELCVVSVVIILSQLLV